jgi:hypothetical protein
MTSMEHYNPRPSTSYRSWKKEDAKDKKPEVNMASFSDFPELGVSGPKKTVFEGVSLASKLKDAIAAEEEAAISKRLKKGDTPEMILRECCVALPLKRTKKVVLEPLQVPDWTTDTTLPEVFPSFRHKTLAQIAKERRWKRMGIAGPLIHGERSQEEDLEDNVSLPEETPPEMEDESEIEEEIPA